MNVDRFLKFLGIVSAVKCGLFTAKWLYRNLIAQSNLKRLGAKRGSYAIITGASYGIGMELAKQGAALGFNLVLIARSEKKLFKLAKDLKEQYGVDVQVVCADCSKWDNFSICDDVVKICQKIDLSVLINNVGMTSDRPLALENHNPSLIQDIIAVNSLFAAQLTAQCIPILKKYLKQKDSSASIVNISSFLSILPSCYYTIYSSSKSFLNQFSLALQCELDGSGITVTNFRPAHVCSSMSGIENPSLLVPSAEKMACCIWSKIGAVGDGSPYLPHAIQELVAGMMPSWVLCGSLRRALRPFSPP